MNQMFKLLDVSSTRHFSSPLDIAVVKHAIRESDANLLLLAKMELKTWPRPPIRDNAKGPAAAS
jgi:hypothetical protein